MTERIRRLLAAAVAPLARLFGLHGENRDPKDMH